MKTHRHATATLPRALALAAATFFILHSAFFIGAPPARAQTTELNIIETTSGSTRGRYTIGLNNTLEYRILNGSTFTLGPTNATQTSVGGAFVIGNTATLIIGPSGADPSGWFIFQGYSNTSHVGVLDLTNANGIVNLTNVAFLNNYANGNAGAIRNNNATATLTGTNLLFISNSANAAGGAIQNAASSGIIDITNVLFKANAAVTAGGAIQNQSTLLVTNGTFTGNYAATLGGALQITSVNARTTLSNVTFTDNRSLTGGGAINQGNNTPLLDITNATFTDNWTAATGGAINNINTTAAPFTLRYTAGGATNNTTDYTSTGNYAGNTTTPTIANLASNTPGFAPLASAGGFYYAAANSTPLTIDIAPTVTLTIGSATATNRAYDTLASATNTALITKTGQGTLTLNANNTYYTGTLAIAQGTLQLGNPQATLGGIITIADAATLAGTGTLISLNQDNTPAPSQVIAAPGSTINIGLLPNPNLNPNPNPSTLTLTDLTFTGANLKFDLFATPDPANPAYNLSDRLNVNGTLDLASTGTILLSTFVTGTYNLGNLGPLADIPGALTTTVVGGLSSRFTTQLHNDASAANALILINTADQSRSLFWTGQTSQTLGVAAGSWLEDTTISPVTDFAPGDKITLDDTHATPAATTHTLQIAAPLALSEMHVAGAADYTLNGPGAITTATRFIVPAALPANTLAANGKLEKTGPGTLTLANTGANNFDGGIELSGGVLAFNTAAQLGTRDTDPASPTYNTDRGITFIDTATLRANADITPAAPLTNPITLAANAKTATLDTNGHNITYAGQLTLATTPTPVTTATLAKTGASALTLTANNTAYQGSTNIAAGALNVTGILGGTTTISSNAALAGSGTLTGAVLASPNSTIAPGLTSAATAPATLTLNNLTLNSSILSFNLYSAGGTGTNDTIHLTGALTLNGTNKVDISAFQLGTYNLGNLAPLAGVEVTIGGVAQSAGARQVAAVIAGNGANGGATGDLLLQTGADMSRILRWTGAATATWISTDTNWTDNASINQYASGDRVIFDSTADTANPANRAIAIAGNGVTVSDMQVQGPANYTFTGAGITATPDSVITGTVLTPADAQGKLYKAGTGTLALNNAANNFTGGIELTAGALTFTAPAQLNTGTNAITFTGPAKLATLATTPQTLANNITIAPNVTGTLDTGANTLTLTGQLTAPGGAATLAKTGAGALTLAPIQNPESQIQNPLTLAIQQGALNLAAATFTGTIDLAPNTLLAATGTNAAAAIRAAANTTLQFAAPNTTLTIDTLQLAATSTLAATANATLTAAAATLTGPVTADIAPGATLTLAGGTGTITGPGGYNKTGAGTLRLDGPAALGNTGPTQLTQGTLNLTGITGTTPDGLNLASTITQTITLNGGTLALGALSTSTTALAETAATAIWTNLALTISPTAAAGGTTNAIRGNNDEILITTPGTFAPALLYGLHAAINPGPGATVILGNTANNFGGIVRIDSGTLQVTDPAQLGGGATGNNASAKIALNGGALRISANITSGRYIEARSATNTITVDDGIMTTWQRISRPSPTPAGPATLIKAGSGTLAITANLAATALTVDAGRYIALANAGLPASSGTVTVHAGATFQFSPADTAIGGTLGYIGDANRPVTFTTSGTLANAFTGSGALEITAGNTALTSAATDIARVAITGPATLVTLQNTLPGGVFAPTGAITIDAATLVLAGNDTTLGHLTLANGATLAFLKNGTLANGVFTPIGIPVRRATLASLASGPGATPTLWFNADIGRNRADHLTILAPVSGTFAIGIAPQGDAPAQINAPLQLIDARQGLAPDSAFVPLKPTIDIGLYKYTVNTIAADGSVTVNIAGTGAMSNSAALINTMAGALPLSWFTELDTVSQRLGELHFETRDARAGNAVWARATGRQINYNTRATGQPFNERTYSGMWGYDHKTRDAANNLYTGAYIGYGTATRHYATAGDGGTDTILGGAYLTISNPATGWYADAQVKLNTFKNTFTANSPNAQTMRARYNNWAIGSSLEVGKFTPLNYGWFIEPQLQAAFTSIINKNYTTDTGMLVMQSSAITAQGRLGFRFGRVIETQTRGTLHVYIKAYGAQQLTTNGKLTIITPGPGGQTARYAPNIEGSRLEAGAGLAWAYTRATQFYADIDTSQGTYFIKPWGLNAGARYAW